MKVNHFQVTVIDTFERYPKMYADLPILFLLYYHDVISQMHILLIIRYIFTKIIEKTKNYCIFKHYVISEKSCILVYTSYISDLVYLVQITITISAIS